MLVAVLPEFDDNELIGTGLIGFPRASVAEERWDFRGTS
jgi:hypothetical protein